MSIYKFEFYCQLETRTVRIRSDTARRNVWRNGGCLYNVTYLSLNLNADMFVAIEWLLPQNSASI